MPPTTAVITHLPARTALLQVHELTYQEAAATEAKRLSVTGVIEHTPEKTIKGEMEGTQTDIDAMWVAGWVLHCTDYAHSLQWRACWQEGRQAGRRPHAAAQHRHYWCTLRHEHAPHGAGAWHGSFGRLPWLPERLEFEWTESCTSRRVAAQDHLSRPATCNGIAAPPCPPPQSTPPLPPARADDHRHWFNKLVPRRKTWLQSGYPDVVERVEFSNEKYHERHAHSAFIILKK